MIKFNNKLSGYLLCSIVPIYIFCFFGMFYFPLNASCGFKISESVNMSDYNATITNSSFKISPVSKPYNLQHPYIYECMNDAIILLNNYSCIINTYQGYDRVECLTSFINDEYIFIFTNFNNNDCFLSPQNINCKLSNIFVIIGSICIGITLLPILVICCGILNHNDNDNDNKIHSHEQIQQMQKKAYSI